MKAIKLGFRNIWLHPDGDRLAEKLMDKDIVLDELEQCKEKLIEENNESNGELFVSNEINSEADLEKAISHNCEYYYAIFGIDYLSEIANKDLDTFNMSNDKFKNYKEKEDADIYEYNEGEINLAWTDDNFSNFDGESLQEIVKEYFNEHINEWLDEAISSMEKGYILDGSSVEIPNKKEFYEDAVDVDFDYYLERFSI